MRTTRKLSGLAMLAALAWGSIFASHASAVYDPAKVQANGTYAELAVDPAMTVEGDWEYIVDFYTNGGGTWRYGIWGPETMYENMTNIDYGATWYWGTQNLVMQFWDWYAANRVYVNDQAPPSIGMVGSDEWELTAYNWSMLNTWHAPSEYAWSQQVYHTTLVDGKDAGDTWLWGSVLGQDLLQVMNTRNYFDHNAGLLFTVRIVSSEKLPSLEWSSPNDSPIGIVWGESVWLDHPDYVPGLGVDFDHDGTNDVTQNTYGVYPILGNFGSFADPGDFDGDGDVDVDDINALCANMTGDGIPLPPGFERYDLDDDGDADSADMDILIHDLVETTVGVGTEYGDFNLDGKIDTVDLTILGTYFGVGTSWSQGNANCDTTVDTVDLTILGTYFGFVASSPIPEPATMALLGLGGLAALIRRRR